MRNRSGHALWIVGALLLSAAASAGCDSTGQTTATTSGSSGSSSGEGGQGASGGNGGAGGQGGAGGNAGQGGAGGGSQASGIPATETVAAGDVAKSPNYKMVFTLGQPTQNQQKTTSPSYRMQGGLIGATESLP